MAERDAPRSVEAPNGGGTRDAPHEWVVRARLACLVLLSLSCAQTRRFSAPVLWVDDDARSYSPAPREAFAPYYWDAVDNMVFRPASDLWRFDAAREAIDVNAVDEVPSSSWFVNRIGRREMSPEEVARGACESFEIAPPAPWRIFAGKPNGATPGFLFEDANGTRYVLKIDRALQPEQATAAHAIVAAVYHAAGYHVPCNRVVGFTRDMLVLEDDAEVELPNGESGPMTEEHVVAVLRGARHFGDGRFRAVLSRFVEGRPIGPWSFRGTREGDPNDVVPHEHRRELRGMFVLNAWMNHWDSRDQNTMSSWVERGPHGYVRHYLIDFDESFGMIEGGEMRARRFGHSQWFDVQHIAEDMVSLGLVQRPWDARTPGPAGNVLGYYDVEGFVPDQWRRDYWNGAFERRTEADMAWMARIIARFTRRHLEALARVGFYGDPFIESELVRVLAGRQRIILERYLTRLSPLADVVLSGRHVCVTDLAVSSTLRWPHDRVYTARVIEGEPSGELSVHRERDGEIVCAELPRLSSYAVVELESRTAGGEINRPLRLHIATATGRRQLVGLERP